MLKNISKGEDAIESKNFWDKLREYCRYSQGEIKSIGFKVKKNQTIIDEIKRSMSDASARRQNDIGENDRIQLVFHHGYIPKPSPVQETPDDLNFLRR